MLHTLYIGIPRVIVLHNKNSHDVRYIKIKNIFVGLRGFECLHCTC